MLGLLRSDFVNQFAYLKVMPEVNARRAQGRRRCFKSVISGKVHAPKIRPLERFDLNETVIIHFEQSLTGIPVIQSEKNVSQ